MRRIEASQDLRGGLMSVSASQDGKKGGLMSVIASQAGREAGGRLMLVIPAQAGLGPRSEGKCQ